MFAEHDFQLVVAKVFREVPGDELDQILRLVRHGHEARSFHRQQLASFISVQRGELSKVPEARADFEAVRSELEGIVELVAQADLVGGFVVAIEVIRAAVERLIILVMPKI